MASEKITRNTTAQDIRAEDVFGAVHVQCPCSVDTGMYVHSGVLRHGEYFVCPTCGKVYRLLLPEFTLAERNENLTNK